ncbi:GntR family transcriptional regulator [Aminiphilus sp.]|uniref:GntR family transcriptional regulator n=1 Tax=Aminiphilus sp. TaxID=1872488 RepID=UPI00261E0BCE|nr:GntR family transcriptional regulator [Aminiphilus sp.]
MTMLDTFDPGSVKPIRDMIYDRLREAVFNGELKPGDRLVESELGDRMSVSRTPVREALRKLEMEGIVEYLPRKGVVVKGFSREDIIEIYSIRQALEVMSTLAAAERITPEELAFLRACLDSAERHMACGDNEAVFKDHQEFTDALIASSKMPRLIQLIGTYREYLHRFRRITLGKKPRQTDVLVQHRAILDAVAEKNLAAVEHLVKAHLQTALDAYLVSLESEASGNREDKGEDEWETSPEKYSPVSSR